MGYQSKPKLSTAEVLHLGFTILGTVSTACLTFITAIFRGKAGHKLYFKHVAHTALRTMNERASARQIQAINPSTIEAYTAFAKAQGFEPNITGLSTTSAKLLWLGKPEASNILICLHGGGFVYPAAAQLQWCWDLRKQTHQEDNYAIALLAYSLAPDAQYPAQLSETIAALRYLVEEKGIDPSKISIVGDSAGALLGLGVISHLLHSHPEIQPLTLAAPLAGIALISPWVTPCVLADSANRNSRKDVVSKRVLEKWSAYALGSAQEDLYNTPSAATAEWWAGVQTVVKDLILTAGRHEVIFDDIESFSARLKSSSPSMSIVFVDETHDQALMDPIIGIKEECESSAVVKSWLVSKCQY